MITFLDTHAFVALGEAHVERFGAESRRLVRSSELLVSPAVLLELHVLSETGKLSVDPDRFFTETLETCDVRESGDSFSAVVREAKSLAWTRDPFDRLIVATALLHRAKLVTKDANIHEHFDDAVW